jgi:predicted dehydrogenase
MTGPATRWGILGTAAIARGAFVPSCRETQAGEVYAVASRSQERAEAFAAELRIPRAFGSYDDLLADPDVDTVYVPLPISHHCEWALRCAEAGKPALVEKPLAATAAEAERMAAAFAARELLLAEALMYRFHPLTRKALAVIREGKLGELRIARASFNAAVSEPDNIRFNKETGGGALLDLGSYCVHFLRQVAGTEPLSVAALAEPAPTGVDRSLAGVLRFPDGLLGYFGCGLDTEFDCSYEVSGTKARLMVERGALCVWPGEEFRIRFWPPGAESDEVIPVPAANPTRLMLDDFHQALRGGTPEFDIVDSISNLRVIDAVRDA